MLLNQKSHSPKTFLPGILHFCYFTNGRYFKLPTKLSFILTKAGLFTDFLDMSISILTQGISLCIGHFYLTVASVIYRFSIPN